jgi:mycofactocin precursor
MTEPTAPTAPEATTDSAPGAASDTGALVEADLLVEDVSIDGMCGVY